MRVPRPVTKWPLRMSRPRSPTVAKVSFGFQLGAGDPERVTQILGVAPTSVHKKGDLSPRMRTPAPWGVWHLSVEDDAVEPAAKRLLEILAGKRDGIAEVVREMGATAAVRIWWEPEEGHGGYTLSSATVRALADLGERVDFSFV